MDGQPSISMINLQKRLLCTTPMHIHELRTMEQDPDACRTPVTCGELTIDSLGVACTVEARNGAILELPSSCPFSLYCVSNPGYICLLSNC